MDSEELISLAQICYNLMDNIEKYPDIFTHKRIVSELHHIQMEILYTAQCILRKEIEEIKEREKQYISFSCIEMEEDK